MRSFTTFAASLATLLSSAAASAAPMPIPAEVRQSLQQDFVVASVDEGRLTEEQGAALLEEQAGVVTRIQEVVADGTITAREIEVLAFLLDRSSRSISHALDVQRAALGEPIPGAGAVVERTAAVPKRAHRR